MKLKSLRIKKSERPDEVSVGYRPKPTLNKATFLLVFAILLSAASFYEGTAFQRTSEASGGSSIASNSTTLNQNPTSNSGVSSQTGSFIRNHLIGQVAAIGSKSITVQDQRTGQNTTLTINDNTQIESEGQSLTTSDIQPGDLVVVSKAGSTSSTAAKIIVAPGSWDSSGSGAGQSSTTTPMTLQSN